MSLTTAYFDYKTASVPRFFQLFVLLFILGTGSLPQTLQALTFGLAGSGESFAAALFTGLLVDLLRVAPLIVLSRHPSGILHPLIIAVVIWPLLTTLPTLIDEFGGYAGFLTGEPLHPPYFTALPWQDADSSWFDLVRYNLLQGLSLLSLYSGFALASRRPRRSISFMTHVDIMRLRKVLIGVIVAMLVGVVIFIQVRGGLIEHIASLSQGRFRALSGLGPFFALFDATFICLLIWICFRPGDARSPLFVVLLVAVAAQQFVVAGSRSAMLTVFVLIGLGWMLRTGRVPWRLAVLLVPIAFLSFGALNIVRTAGFRNTTALEAVQDARFSDILIASRAEFEQRQALAGSVPITADAVRTTGLMWGYTYSGALFALVPRTLWEDKPRGPGSMYAQVFLGESREGQAVPVSPVAEAFWNFHVPGVIVIFALYGFLIKRASQIYESNRENGFAIAGFVLFLTQFGVGTEQLVAAQQAALTFVFVLIMLWISFPKPRRSVALSQART